MKQGPNNSEDYHVIYNAGWNAAIKAIIIACEEQINRSSRVMDRGAVYQEVASNLNNLLKTQFEG